MNNPVINSRNKELTAPLPTLWFNLHFSLDSIFFLSLFKLPIFLAFLEAFFIYIGQHFSLLSLSLLIDFKKLNMSSNFADPFIQLSNSGYTKNLFYI